MWDPSWGEGNTSAPASAWTGASAGAGRDLNSRLRSLDPVRTEKAPAVTALSIGAWVCDPSRRPCPDCVCARVGKCPGGTGWGWLHHQGCRWTSREDGSQVRAQGPSRLGWDHGRSSVPSILLDTRSGRYARGPASLSISTVAYEAILILLQAASEVMTLNGGGSRGAGRERERRRGSTPWGPAPLLHRRSMPVDERDLQAALAPSALATAAAETGTQGPRLDWPESSSDSLSSGGSDSDESVYKVLLLGAPGVGKSALARIFGGLEDGPEAEVAGEGLGLFKGGKVPGLGLGATVLGTWSKSSKYQGIVKTLSESCLYLPISQLGKLREKGPLVEEEMLSRRPRAYI